MKFLKSLLNLQGKAKKTRRSLADVKQELLVRHGTEQFKVLMKKGLQIPVVML